jgi:hypothetical protein
MARLFFSHLLFALDIFAGENKYGVLGSDLMVLISRSNDAFIWVGNLARILSTWPWQGRTGI